ncbi:MAG: UPF0146 family protein, partial [Methanocellales archaeon]|nr:UPF0146 family protein [Methanocellales archaeon]
MVVIMVRGHKDLAEYIASSYGGKVIEVGIGRHSEVALLLKDHLEIIVTDTSDLSVEGINFIRDDIFDPNIRIYEGASLIYSIRPPLEIQHAIASVAKRVGADLIIRPFASEKTDLNKYFDESKLINYGSAVFYLY